MKGIHVILAVVVLGIIALLFVGDGSFRSNELQDPVTQTEEVVIIEDMEEELTLTSSAFENGESMPEAYSCDGEGVNPPLSIGNPPEGTVSFTLLVDDPDIPEVVKKARLIQKFDHWTLFNVPGETVSIEENDTANGVVGMNSAGDNEFRGACPPPEYEPTEHRYIFQLYALDTMLDLEEGVTQEEVRAAMKGHILAKTELVGLYDRAPKEDQNNIINN